MFAEAELDKYLILFVHRKEEEVEALLKSDADELAAAYAGELERTQEERAGLLNVAGLCLHEAPRVADVRVARVDLGGLSKVVARRFKIA